MKQQSATPKFGGGRHNKFRHAASAPEVQAITNAAAPHSEEMHQRMVKYSVTMGIRMVCLVAIFAFDGWYKIIPIVGAVLLPWVAVILANGGADVNHQESVDLLDEAPLYAVTGTDPAMDDGAPAPGDILDGEIVPDEERPVANSAEEGSAAQESAAEESAADPQHGNYTKEEDHGHP